MDVIIKTNYYQSLSEKDKLAVNVAMKVIPHIIKIDRTNGYIKKNMFTS